MKCPAEILHEFGIEELQAMFDALPSMFPEGMTIPETKEPSK
jgi:hypothetical protein